MLAHAALCCNACLAADHARPRLDLTPAPQNQPTQTNRRQSGIYTADGPELCRISGIKCRSLEPYDQCWVLKEFLALFEGPPQPPRTTMEQMDRQRRVEEQAQASRAAGEAEAGRLSTLRAPCGLLGFADRDSPETDLHN